MASAVVASVAAFCGAVWSQASGSRWLLAFGRARSRRAATVSASEVRFTFPPKLVPAAAGCSMLRQGSGWGAAYAPALIGCLTATGFSA